MPLRTSLAAIFRQPGIVFAEIAWRWTFGASALTLAAFAIVRLEHAITIYPEEQEMLSSRSPVLIAQAILEIGHRARPLAVHLGIIVIPAILLLWIIAATVGRGYVLSRLPSREWLSPRWLVLSALNLLRVVSVLLLVVAYFGCSFATSLVINPYAPNYALGILVFFSLFMISLAAWSFLHWIVSTSCIYASRQHLGLFQSLDATMQLLRTSSRELFSIAAQNSSVRTLVALIFTLFGLLPLIVYRVPPLFLTAEIVLFLAYCIASDMLVLARLAAYVEVIERPTETAAAEPA